MAEIRRRTPLDTLLSILNTEARAVTDLLPGAQEFEWEAGPRKQARAPGAHMTAGTISDPTADTALDERRLALREAVSTATARIDALRRLTIELRGARRALEDALRAYGMREEQE